MVVSLCVDVGLELDFVVGWVCFGGCVGWVGFGGFLL